MDDLPKIQLVMPSPDQIKAQMDKIVRDRMRQAYAARLRERAMQGYVEIKASDFN